MAIGPYESYNISNGTMVQLFKGIAGSLEDPAFETICEKMYVVELLRFAQEVNFYKKNYYDKSDAWRKAKIAHIVERYIKDSSPMQVNISHDLRESVEKAQCKFDGSAVGGSDIFDDAKHEITILLFDVHRRYMDSDSVHAQHQKDVSLSQRSISMVHENAVKYMRVR